MLFHRILSYFLLLGIDLKLIQFHLSQYLYLPWKNLTTVTQVFENKLDQPAPRAASASAYSASRFLGLLGKNEINPRTYVPESVLSLEYAIFFISPYISTGFSNVILS